MPTPFDAVTFLHGPAMKNRFMLAPLTNQQSNPDGTLSDDEERWLTMRAAGGFGMTMTCASHVDPRGQGFPGQLGCFSDDHLPGLTRLADGIRAQGSVAMSSCTMRGGAHRLSSSERRPSHRPRTPRPGHVR